MAKHWIKDAIKHPGALHKELHVKEGEKIPKRKLEKAAKKVGKEGRRARLAETLEGMHHGGHAKRAERESKRVRKEHHEHRSEHSHGEHPARSYEREMDREDRRSTLVKPAPPGPVPRYSERTNAKMDRHMSRHIKVTKS